MPAHVTTDGSLGRPRKGSVLFALGVVGTVIVLSVVGVVLAAGAWRAGSEPVKKAFPAEPGKDYGPFEVADDVPTSFGAMSVKHAERVNGLTAKSLAGMTHGINGLVREKSSRIQATVTVTNLLDRPHAYRPERFTLRTSVDGKPIRVAGASVKPGTLQPDASIDFRVDFNAPRKAKRFWIDFADPGRAAPLTVDLGRVKALQGSEPKASKDAQEALLSTANGNHDGHGE